MLPRSSSLSCDASALSVVPSVRQHEEIANGPETGDECVDLRRLEDTAPSLVNSTSNVGMAMLKVLCQTD